MKPDLAAFMDVFAVPGIKEDDRILFIDDRPINVDAARIAGFYATVADPQDEWLDLARSWASGNGVVPARE